MTIEDVRSYAETIDEEIVIFDNPSYDNSIVGITTDNRVVYDLDLMIKDLMDQDNISVEEAIDFIDYNTLGSLGNIENGPIVMRCEF